MTLLEVRNLCKSFGSNEVLRDVSFCADGGEILALTGASGSGKTTLLRCLNFLEAADSGQIFLDGELLYDAAERYSERSLRVKRRNFGFVFQSFNLFPQYTALQNVTLALDVLAGERQRGSALRQQRQQNAAAAEELLRRVGLGDKLGSYPFELSGGQQQRVAIARALALKPKILCFDEPTSALDSALSGEVIEFIESLTDTERAILIITHDPLIAARYKNYSVERA